MTNPPDLRDLVGEDVPSSELDRLRQADAVLRAVPAPPASVPESLTRAVVSARRRPRRLIVPRLAAAVALAGGLAAVFLALAALRGDEFEAKKTVILKATAHAPAASARVLIGERDESGNFGMEVVVSGLRRLPRGGYYVLWLAKDGEYAGTCGTFAVGDGGSADVYMNASYRLSDYDAFVVSAWLPRQEPAETPDRLLTAKI